MLIWGLHTSQYLVIFKGKTCIFNFLQYNYFLNEFEGIKFWVVTLHIFRLNSLKFSFSFDIYWQSKVKTLTLVIALAYWDGLQWHIYCIYIHVTKKTISTLYHMTDSIFKYYVTSTTIDRNLTQIGLQK